MASNQVDLGDYTFTRHKDNLLGAGGFGKVWSGERKTETEGLTDQNVAIKEIEINVHTNKFIDRERNLMRELKRKPHENVIRFIDSVRIHYIMYFIMEMCTLGDLHNFMKTQTENTFNLCLKIMHCTSSGLRHLHNSIKLCHRDIKPANILVTGNSVDYHMKIADLGLARTIEDSSSTPDLTRRVGTWGWMAPEMPVTANASDSYSLPVDVFALGLLFASVFRFQPGGQLEVPDEQGIYLALWLKSLDTVNLRVLELDLRFRGGRFVTQAMTLIRNMLSFSASDRYNIDQVCTDIQHISGTMADGPVTPDDTTIHTKPRAEASRHVIGPKENISSPTAASPGDAPAAAGSVTSAEASTVSPAEGDVLSQLRELPFWGHSIHDTPAAGCDLELRRLGHITVPITDEADMFFGQANLLVGFEQSPGLFYYEYQSSELKLVWNKSIPKEVEYDCLKHISPRGEFFLQSGQEVCLFDQELRLISRLMSPGQIICLLPGGERAVVDNSESPSTQTEGIRLALTSTVDLHNIKHQLDVPADGPYSTKDLVLACGVDDGRLAVVLRNKPFCDLYDASGRHTERTLLPGGAGEPSCTSEYILVPLYLQPMLWVLDWAGHVTRILDHTELGVEKDDYCYGVSPVNNGLVSVIVGSAARQQYLINTYQVL